MTRSLARTMAAKTGLVLTPVPSLLGASGRLLRCSSPALPLGIASSSRLAGQDRLRNLGTLLRGAVLIIALALPACGSEDKSSAGKGAITDRAAASLQDNPGANRSTEGAQAPESIVARNVEPKVEEPKVEEPKVEEPKVEEPKVEKPKVEEPKVEEPKVEKPKVEKPKVEEPKVEEPKVEEPKVEKPKVEEPKVEEPKVEEPKVEKPKVEPFPTYSHKFMGANQCKMCHNKDADGAQYKVWAASKHAKAWETLGTDEAKRVAQARGVSGDPQAAPQCLKCHQTGYGAPPDLLTAKFDPKLGVQCEACHGPGGDYAKKEVMKERAKSVAAGLILPDEKTCIRCHNPESPSYRKFDFAEFKKKIAHPVPQK